MNRPPLHSNQAPPARRRIVPEPVTQDENANSSNNNDFNQPLVVPPPPATGNSKDISKFGPGRRVFVNIDNKVEVKWKDVLRQQGLDIYTWRKHRDQKLARLEAVTGAQGAAKRRDVTGILAKKHQQLYEESDGDEGESDEEDEGESGDEGEGEEGDGAASSGEHDEDEDDAEDDDEEEKEGNETGGEVDLEKEAEAEQQQAKAKRKRQRFERYDDDFIDDSELETVKVAARAKTKFSGFYVTQGGVETIEEAPKPRARPKPRQPKTADPAAAAGAAASGPASSGPGKKRKQPAQQEQQQIDTGGEAAPNKKRQRSETPASVAAASQDPKPAAGKNAKPSPAPPTADAADAATAAGTGAGPGSSAAAEAAASRLPSASPAAAHAGGKSTAQMALAAAMAAKNKKAAPAAGTQHGATGSAAAAVAGAGIIKEVSRKAAQDASRQQQGAVPSHQPNDTSAAAALAAAAPTPTKAAPAAALVAEAAATKEAASKADTVNKDAAEAAAAAAAGGAVAAAKAAGLPAGVVAAVEALQKAVAEHKPAAPGTSSSAANMSKAVKTVLDALGVTFARQPHQVREQHAAVLVSVLAPLMLPYMKEKKLRRLVLEEPVKKTEELDNTKAALMAELEQGAELTKGTSSADGANDDFQAQLSTAAADALVAAWTAAKDVPDVLSQLALDVCSKLGWSQVQGSPSKAVAELLPVVKKAKKRLSKHKQHSQEASGRQSPEPTEPVIVDAAAGDVAASAPGPTPKKRGGSSNLDNHPTGQPVVTAPIALAAAAAGNGSSTAAAAAPGASQKQSQKQDKEKEHWSQFGAPSPRLQQCVEAAVAAGADRQWLSDKYTTLKGSYMHQAFRTLCMSGPKGCLVPEFVARAAEHNLGFSNEDNKAVRRAVKQSLQTVTMTNIVGTTEAEPKAFALLCFSGVQQQPARPSKAAADATGSQQVTQAAAE